MRASGATPEAVVTTRLARRVAATIRSEMHDQATCPCDQPKQQPVGVRRAIGEEALGVTATRLVQMGMLPRSCRSKTGLRWTPDPASRAFGTQPSVRQGGTVTPPSWVQSCPMLSCICGGEAHSWYCTAQRRSHPRDGCATELNECASCSSCGRNHAPPNF
jgi:hypothetical protein